MNDNRRQILDMLAEGKVTAEEAERLIAALERGGVPAARPPGNFKYLRVLVDANDPLDGPTKVNVRVPMQLLRAGVKLTGVIPDRARDQVNEAMRKEGIRRIQRSKAYFQKNLLGAGQGIVDFGQREFFHTFKRIHQPCTHYLKPNTVWGT